MVQSETNFLRATMPLTISPISLWISGSPPGIATIGAPHSSTASRHSCTDIRRFRIASGIVDLAATDAGQVAPEQRLQHQHQRIAFAAHHLLLEKVGAKAHLFEKRYRHRLAFSFVDAGSALAGEVTSRRQFGRQPELDVLLPAGQCRDFDRTQPPQRLNDILDQHVRRRGARRNADRARVLDPVRVKLAAIRNQIARNPRFGPDFAQAIGIRAVLGADHQDHVDELCRAHAPRSDGSASRNRYRAFRGR